MINDLTSEGTGSRGTFRSVLKLLAARLLCNRILESSYLCLPHTYRESISKAVKAYLLHPEQIIHRTESRGLYICESLALVNRLTVLHNNLQGQADSKSSKFKRHMYTDILWNPNIFNVSYVL